jgi:membrane fusion protein (multidrug efflux system)
MNSDTNTRETAQPAAQGGPDDRLMETTESRRRVNPFLIGGIALVLLVAGIGWYIYSTGFEDTDDAQVDGHLNPIASRIDGTIKAVYVDDNQGIKPGMLLVELDPSDDQIELEQTRRSTIKLWRN